MKYENLEVYFAPDGGQGGGDGNPPVQNNQNQQTQPGAQAPSFDYEKLAGIIAGKQTVTEETILKNYFKQQGLSQEEAQQAIAAFKEQKAANQPNVEVLQQQTSAAQMQAQQALIERDAYLLSGELGVDLKTMPYILKMADLSSVLGEDGKVNQDKLKEALNKVLEDLPQLKPQTEVQQNGFRQIGVGNSGQQTVTKPTEQVAVPTKKWNRWN